MLLLVSYLCPRFLKQTCKVDRQVLAVAIQRRQAEGVAQGDDEDAFGFSEAQAAEVAHSCLFIYNSHC